MIFALQQVDDEQLSALMKAVRMPESQEQTKHEEELVTEQDLQEKAEEELPVEQDSEHLDAQSDDVQSTKEVPGEGVTDEREPGSLTDRLTEVFNPQTLFDAHSHDDWKVTFRSTLVFKQALVKG